ncbi:hypothetical protein Acr_18g0010300 [Actinidia rufa]|uniref:Uncharacterized protein n=1 Tax=Actinidia rufa TaxID=165716 RepID=A0A7J0G7U0_9ERIC|nr:hypothetical protein Acr_18g0010300 [Actinidia rufa]
MVLRTPVFQNCIPANEIREQMKLLMDLYKEITAETISIGKCKNMLEGQVLSEIHDWQKPIEHHQPSPADRAFAKASEEKQTQGSHVVGGSAFGWNFITYQGSKAVYYGRTKEMFRSANVIPQGSPS